MVCLDIECIIDYCTYRTLCCLSMTRLDHHKVRLSCNAPGLGLDQSINQASKGKTSFHSLDDSIRCNKCFNDGIYQIIIPPWWKKRERGTLIPSTQHLGLKMTSCCLYATLNLKLLLCWQLRMRYWNPGLAWQHIYIHSTHYRHQAQWPSLIKYTDRPLYK